ncbi:hypothetical protein WJX74_000429 [Apatococcus lobatus]|uniref:Enhancer of polycomb-like protein n=1 Tax=Apatococcus lobatus TaxID=904363 RepID=A0AAW1RKZ5_9CHLO
MVKQRDSLVNPARKESGRLRRPAAQLKKASGPHRLSGKAGRTTLTRRAAPCENDRRPLEPRQANRPEDFQRLIRPRPLHVEDQMRVFWGDSDLNLKQIDDGAFAKWLESQETSLASTSAATSSMAACAGHNQTAVVGYGFSPLPGTLADQTRICGMGMLDRAPASRSPAWLSGSEEQQCRPPSRRSKQGNSTTAAGAAITIPSFRMVKRQPPEAASTDLAKPADSSQPVGYIRYVAPTAEEQDTMVEYDMDSDDDEWLIGYQQQLRGRSSCCAGRKAKRRKQEHGASQHEVADKDGDGSSEPLSEGAFERIIDTLEKAHHANLQALCSSGSIRTGQSIPPAPSVLDEDAALAVCKGFSGSHVSAVYSHWLTKQVPTRRPLLQRLWFQAPWHSLGLQWGNSKPAQGPSVHASREDASDSEECLPFVGRDTPPPVLAAHLPAMSEEEAHALLDDARADLERLRTLIDQVRRRERLKHRLAKIRQQEIALQLGPFSELPPVPTSISPAIKPGQSTRASRKPHNVGKASQPAAPLLGQTFQTEQQPPSHSQLTSITSFHTCPANLTAGHEQTRRGSAGRHIPDQSQPALEPAHAQQAPATRSGQIRRPANRQCGGHSRSIKTSSKVSRHGRQQTARDTATGEQLGSPPASDAENLRPPCQHQPGLPSPPWLDQGLYATEDQPEDHVMPSTRTSVQAPPQKPQKDTAAGRSRITQQTNNPRLARRLARSRHADPRQPDIQQAGSRKRANRKVRFDCRPTRSTMAAGEVPDKLDLEVAAAAGFQSDHLDFDNPRHQYASKHVPEEQASGDATSMPRKRQRSQAAALGIAFSRQLRYGNQHGKQTKTAVHTPSMALQRRPGASAQAAAQAPKAGTPKDHAARGQQADPHIADDMPDGEASPAVAAPRATRRSAAHAHGAVEPGGAALSEAPRLTRQRGASEHHVKRSHAAAAAQHCDTAVRQPSQQRSDESSVDGGSAASQDEVNHADSAAVHTMPALKVTSARRRAANSHQLGAPGSCRRRMYSLNASPEEPASSIEQELPCRSHALQSPCRPTPPRTRKSQVHHSAGVKIRKGSNARSPLHLRKDVVRSGFTWLRNLMYGSRKPGDQHVALVSSPRSLRSKKQMVTRSHHS